MKFKKGDIPWNRGRKGDKHTEKTRLKMSKAKISNTNMMGKTREECNNWKGGFKKDKDGYTLFIVPEGCKFSSMKDGKGYVRVHRLIMAAYLGRPLRPEEVVHHIDGDITNNKIENLKLVESNSGHIKLHWKLRLEEV